MINIQYNLEENKTRIETGDLDVIKDHIPLVVIFRNIITREEEYRSELYSNCWCYYSPGEHIVDLEIYSSQGTILQTFEWTPFTHGGEIEKRLYYYLLARKKGEISSNGLVIGSHDGRSGEWIYPVVKKMTSVTLIDGGDDQFISLRKNYENFSNVKLINNIVTPDGGDVDWFFAEEGYQNTVVPSVIYDWFKDKNIEIIREKRKSLKMSDLMNLEMYDWVHLDVEGLDSDLILSMDSFPNLIIFENMNLSEEKNRNLNEWFSYNGYQRFDESGNSIAIKNDKDRI
jgi:hypothetical protein